MGHVGDPGFLSRLVAVQTRSHHQRPIEPLSEDHVAIFATAHTWLNTAKIWLAAHR